MSYIFIHNNTGKQRGIPNDIMLSNYRAIKIESHTLPDVESAVHNFEEGGGHLTIFNCFGEDPLHVSPTLVAQREAEFYRHYPDFGKFFYSFCFFL